MFEEKLSRFSEEIKELYLQLEHLVFTAAPNAQAKLWAGLPSYYMGEKFVRLIPSKDHINIEASALLNFKAQLQDYQFTPKNMLQIFIGQAIPTETLTTVFYETLSA